jgi:excisionase family DNA binding protein
MTQESPDVRQTAGLSIDETARVLNFSGPTVRRRIDEGVLRTYPNRSTVRVVEEDVYRLVVDELESRGLVKFVRDHAPPGDSPFGQGDAVTALGDEVQRLTDELAEVRGVLWHLRKAHMELLEGMTYSIAPPVPNN